MLAVALLWTAVPAGVFAREFRRSAPQNDDYPIVQALAGGLIAERTGGRHHIAALHPLHPIKRIRNME
ncbi:hypothetical protein [Bradyrhizobium sp. i1.12.3]